MPFESDIEDIMTTIWSTLDDVPIEPGGASDDSTVTGIVHIEGAWHGAVDEIRDALGELTNMVAGNDGAR